MGGILKKTVRAVRIVATDKRIPRPTAHSMSAAF
jgi:hypothetical protein